MQIGENEDSLIDFTSMQNAADAHLLAADRLASPISPEYPVAGEAFFITNGDPMSVWDLWRRIYARFDEYFPGKIVAPRMTYNGLHLVWQEGRRFMVGTSPGYKRITYDGFNPTLV